MQTFAHFADGGPGPWILFTLLRRTGWRPRGGPRPTGPDDNSPITVLGHRFASGEIDEDEYWRRLSVLNEEFGRMGKGGPM